MQSWSLKNFVRDKGLDEALRVTKLTTRQGVYAAYPRTQIVQTDDEFYQVWIKKLKHKVAIDE